MSKHYCWQDNIVSLPKRYVRKSILQSNVLRAVSLSLFLLFIAIPANVYAEGSKDLYPAGVSGNRAFLYSNSYTGTNGSTNTSWPFKTLGTHYVYAEIGEVIAVASSAQNMGNGRIRLTAPDGQQYITSASDTGRIFNRVEELAGPRYPGQPAGGNRYQPFTQTVGVGQEGVWKIEFLPTGDANSDDTPSVTSIEADTNWTQSSNSELIAAWDVSVRNAANTAWLAGRVYTNVFNLHISGSQFTAADAFYGRMYVLTKDGIAYLVTNNGNNGVGFTFFVNNKGFLDNLGNSLYQSLDLSNPNDPSFNVHDPRDPDGANNVTHKIFYTVPAADLPASAIQAVDTSTQVTTWLKNIIVTPTVSNVTYTGIEGTPNLSGNKGANIGFDSNLAGSYRIEIAIPGFTTRVLTGSTTPGTNTVFWDGKDGDGNTLAPSTTISGIKVQLFGAEVHFPFIDMEINPGGVIIEQLDGNYDLFTPTRDLVYWDDSNITGGTVASRPDPIASGSAGISSNDNGHAWGTYVSGGGSGSGNTGTGLSSFGNTRSLDTWSFVPGNEIEMPLNIVVASADLEVESILPSTGTATIGDEIDYTVVVKNNGPSDVTLSRFAFVVPEGFTITNVSYTTSTGTILVANGTIDSLTGNYTADLDLSNGAAAEFVITGTIGASLGGVAMVMEASIMRPNDVTDPDATNPGLTPPTDPHIECLNGTASEDCNNIKYNTITPAAQANLTVSKTVDTTVPTVGQQVEFTVTVTNNGPNDATGVNVTDQLPTGFTYVSHNVSTGAYNTATGIWNIGTLADTAAETMTIIAAVNATGDYTNVATVQGNETDPTPGDDSDDATSAPETEADLSIEKTVDALSPEVGSEVEFTLTAANNGPANATGVVVTDLLPTGYTYISHTTGTGAYLPETGVWTIGSFADAATASLTITATVNATGDYTNTASIEGTETDPDNTNDEDSVTVDPVNVIVANDDTHGTAVNGYDGGTPIIDVLGNDIINNVTLNPADVSITVVTPASNAGVELDIITGAVTVDAGTPEGTYIIEYSICEIADNTNCDEATITIAVEAALIAATDDSATGINGYEGAQDVVNVLDNDVLNGVGIAPSEVTITLLPGGDTELTLDPSTGLVDVALDTAEGTYTLEYQICENLNPSNCSTATVTVAVEAALIAATDDSVLNINGYTGATNVINVFTNDELNNDPVVPAEVKLTFISGDDELILDTTDGSVDVAANSNGGTYTLTYQICEVLNPANCDTAIVTVFVMIPELTLTKDAQAGTYDSVGDVITYDLVLTNSGNVTVTDITIADANAESITPSTVATLAPGASVSITATHAITQADLDAGYVYNRATATGQDPEGEEVTDESEDPTDPSAPGDPGYDPACADCTVTTITQDPQMQLFKDAVYEDTNGDDVVNPGDRIIYSFTVNNTGNTTITNVSIEDPLVTVTGGPINLAPDTSDSATFTADYIINQNDVENGAVYNLAFVVGTDSLGDPIIDESEDPTPLDEGDPLTDPACPECTVTPLVQSPAMVLIKTAEFNDDNGDGMAQAGETITYRFSVTNTGNVTLTDVVLTDELPRVLLSGGPIAVLEIGETDNTTYTAVYHITQQDINNGLVSNQALATARAAGSVLTVSSDDSDTIGTDPTVTKLEGCTVKVFNGLSLDGNGVNDSFYIGGIECYPNNEVHIFNRWGVSVYDARGYNNDTVSFKGYSEGRATVSDSSQLPEGTYFYVLQYTATDGSTHKKDGYLYITR